MCPANQHFSGACGEQWIWLPGTWKCGAFLLFLCLIATRHGEDMKGFCVFLCTCPDMEESTRSFCPSHTLSYLHGGLCMWKCPVAFLRSWVVIQNPFDPAALYCKSGKSWRRGPLHCHHHQRQVSAWAPGMEGCKGGWGDAGKAQERQEGTPQTLGWYMLMCTTFPPPPAHFAPWTHILEAS